MSKSRLPIFGDLPDTIFQPLAGPNRRAHAAVLDHLHRSLFGPDSDAAPAKREVAAEIEEAIRLLGVPVECEDVGINAPGNETGLAHYWIYYRLKEAGWLTEQRDRWDTLVEMRPAALALLDALSDIGSAQGRSLGAGVASVMTNLEAAAARPEESAASLDGAYDTALRFNRHMRAMVAGLAAIEEQVLADSDALRTLRSFFDDFVAGHLIADYRNLLGPNNPYRFRARVQQLLRDLLADDPRRTTLAAAYAAQLGIPEEEAEVRVFQRLDAIDRAFDSIERQRQRIDRFRARLEKRVQNTLRYLDLTGGGLADRLAATLARLGRLPQTADAVIEIMGSVAPLPTPASARSLPHPPRERAQARPSRLRIRPEDPLARLYREACSAFDRRIRITPERLRAYIERNLGPHGRLNAAEFHIDDLEDLFAFLQIPALDRFGDPGLRRDFRVERRPGLAGNDWIAVSDFALVRRREAGC